MVVFDLFGAEAVAMVTVPQPRAVIRLSEREKKTALHCNATRRVQTERFRL